ncbi:MAG: 4Fe-4S binding protein [Coriobacteriia bacterium]|nr:4Fe-4S binding protein [Coriobacteriia bacterium]
MSTFQPEYQKRLAKAIGQKKGIIPFGIGFFKVLKVAFLNLFRRNIVVQYPNEKYELPERARYAMRMKYDEEGHHKCRACLICEKACPDYIIRIEVETGEDRSKFIKRFEYQQGGCMMCGLCVEACPFDAIRMSHEYEIAHSDPALLTIDLLENVPAAVAAPRAEKEPTTREGGSADA